MRYVRIDAGVVVEIGEFDGDVATMFHPSLIWIASDVAQVGDVWDGQTFATPAPPAPNPDDVMLSVEQAVQRRLDDFAATRNYDGILSACTYAASAITQFKTEGQYCVDLRDQTWSQCYSIMGAVQAGQRPLPTVEQVMSELPVPAWPA